MKGKNKIIMLTIMTIAILTVAIGLILAIINKQPKPVIEEKIEIDAEKYEMEFDSIFDNKNNEYVVSRGSVERKEAGKYNINVHIPEIIIESNITKEINKEIYNTFIDKIIQIGEESSIYTIVNMNYSTQINGNILSIAIKFVLKEGSSPQRTMIKTYNYNLEEDKIIDISEVISDEQKVELQEKLDRKIASEIKKEKTIAEQGYNIYRRDADSDIYKIENATDFYIGEGKILYIIYAYGNNSYTSETDLIITKANI